MEMAPWCLASLALHAAAAGLVLALAAEAGRPQRTRVYQVTIVSRPEPVPAIAEVKPPAPLSPPAEPSPLPLRRSKPSPPPARMEPKPAVVPAAKPAPEPFPAPPAAATPVVADAPSPVVVAPTSPAAESTVIQVPAVPPTAGAPAPSAGPETALLVRQRYLAELQRRIDRYKEYPVLARRGEQQGRVVVRFVLGRSGALREALILLPSGYPLLDKAALRAVHAAGDFPAVPADIAGEQVVFDLPLTFRLVGR